MKITREAIDELYPNTAYVIKNDSVLEILDDTVVSYEDIVQKGAELDYKEEVNEYQRQRAVEYPSYASQFDKIFHEGVDAWKAEIQATKDKYPKVAIDATELQVRRDKAIFDLQAEKYAEATERLSRYILSEGVADVTENQVIGTKEVWNEETLEKEEQDIIGEVIIKKGIDPIAKTIEVTEYDQDTEQSITKTIPNPLVVEDEEERRVAQEIIDSTPQEVIEAYNSAL